jgi:hypothetical protein
VPNEKHAVAGADADQAARQHFQPWVLAKAERPQVRERRRLPTVGSDQEVRVADRED